MSRRLLLDGDDLRSLMLRVRDEMGPDAKIVKAERIRTGGIAGFFAREHYELTVEVPERPRRRLGSRPGGPTPGATIDARPGIEPSAMAGIDALLAAADAAERAGEAPGPPGPPEAPESHDAVAPQAPPSAEAPEPTPVEPPAPPHVSTAGDTFALVLESMRQIVGTEEEAAEPWVPRGSPVPPAPEGAAGPTDPTVTVALAPDGTPLVVPALVPDDDAPVVVPALVPDEPLAPLPGRRDRYGSSVTSMLELGIPTRLLAGFTDLNAPVPLSQMVRRFEKAPVARLRAGHVMALVGSADITLRTATQMAHRAGIDPHDVVLAGEIDPVAGHGRRLQSVAAVERWRARVPAEAPSIVVLAVAPQRERWTEAADLLRALAPDDAWAVVDARLKAVEQRRWLRAVSTRRPFDAVAATSTFEAQAPGTVLNLGLPVGWVDGLPASPVVWAAVLSERMADDARWD